MIRKQIWFDCNPFYIRKISLEMTARFSKNIFIFRLVFTGQKLTVLIFVSKVIRSAKLTLARLHLTSQIDFWRNSIPFFGAVALCTMKIDDFRKPPQKGKCTDKSLTSSCYSYKGYCQRC